MIKIKEKTDMKIYNSLRRWYYAASDEQIKSGKDWYSEAQDYAQYLSMEFTIDKYKCAAVISALSPNNKWQRNKVDAFNVIQAWRDGKDPDSVKCCTYNSNKRKAFAILSGDIELSAKSPKTHSFAMNVGMLSDKHVTVDKWHIRACLCTPSDGVTETQESVTPVQYRRIEAITNTLAEMLGIKAYELQAIIWVTIKDQWNR